MYCNDEKYSNIVSINFEPRRVMTKLRVSHIEMYKVLSVISLASKTSTSLFIKNLLLMVGSSLAMNLSIFVPFCGMDHQKSHFSLICIWEPFCRRLLKPVYSTFLKTDCKYQNIIISGTHRTDDIHEIINLDTC